jgi:lysophosphatidylcholine acyltransferase/lyso-PAF acetyltransferase
VTLRYPYSCFCVTWETIPFTYHVFRVLTEFTHKMEVTYLPVYFPSADELANPQLYADNVQKLMAGALKVPATQHTIKDKISYHQMIISGKISWHQKLQ